MKAYDSQLSWNQQQNSDLNPDSEKKFSNRNDPSFTLIGGRLVANPVLNQTKTGKSVGKFTIAMNMNQVGGQESTLFLDVETWEARAKACYNYLKKGSRVIVQGYLKQDKWQNEKGENRSKIKLVAGNVIFIPNKLPENKTENL